jgi:hypothetical protein
MDCPLIKLEQILQWIEVFCNKCAIADPLKREVLDKWNDSVHHFENDMECVANSVQAFFEDLLNLTDEKCENSEEEKKAIRRLVSCMAAISQKLYTDPGVCVGQTTKPDGHASAYADIPNQKCIDIIFDNAGCIVISITVEKEVNEWMRGENGKPEFLEFPNVRLKLNNTMRSNLLELGEWRSTFRVTVGVERILDAMGKPAIPTDVYKKVIRPLIKVGFLIDHVYSYT